MSNDTLYKAKLSFDKLNGKLHFLNKQPSGGDHPCYIVAASNKKWVLAANYTGGSFAAFPLNKDGSLQPFAQLIQDTGSSIVKGRQDKPHVHATFFSPDERYVYNSFDLGTIQQIELTSGKTVHEHKFYGRV